MPSQLVKDCSRLLRERELTIAFAESATAGRLASEFSLTPDSGKILQGGVVCYDAFIKEDILKIPADFIKKYSPESAEVTHEMARRLRGLIKSDIYVANTGLTTPGGSETPEKPVGTMFVHVLYKDNSVSVRKVFEGPPEIIVLQTADLVASTLIQELSAVVRA
jgi:nicotinamide-nucleotide amidase